MITKAEWSEWKQHKITKKLVELLEAGVLGATRELVGTRGEVGDYQRGSIFAYEDIKEEIRTGDNIVEESE